METASETTGERIAQGQQEGLVGTSAERSAEERAENDSIKENGKEAVSAANTTTTTLITSNRVLRLNLFALPHRHWWTGQS